MTRLETIKYFMAHAPIAPDWFVPKIYECPKVPVYPEYREGNFKETIDFYVAERSWGNLTHVMDNRRKTHEITSDFKERVEKYCEELDAFNIYKLDYTRQKTLQWPYYWGCQQFSMLVSADTNRH